MALDTLIGYLESLQPGERLDATLALARSESDVTMKTEVLGGETERYFRIDSIDVEILPEDAGDPNTLIEAISFGPGFSGAINGIRMGMTGDEVEDEIGSPDRLWPMPHPNYVLLYDYPHFFRIELDRETERVIRMMR